MSREDYPTPFLNCLRELFPDVDGAADRYLAKLYRVWETAQDDERRAAFKFMRGTLERSEDKEGLVQLSWVIGNGTYRKTPDLSTRPWWLQDEEDWKAYVVDRLDIRRENACSWMIHVRETNEHVARIAREEGYYEVWHASPDSAADTEIRCHQTWQQAVQDVVARQVMREKDAQKAQTPGSV